MKLSTPHITAVAFLLGLSVIPNVSRADTIYGDLCNESMVSNDPLRRNDDVYGPHCSAWANGQPVNDFGWLHAERQPDGSTIVEMKVEQGYANAPRGKTCSGTVECEGFFYRTFDEGTSPYRTDIITPNTWCEINDPGSSTVSTCQWRIDYYPLGLDMACDCRY